jgi:hypothetical protein
MLDNCVLAALDQSNLPAFLPHSGRLSHQVMSARAYGLERAPLDQRKPHHFACLLICRRAWHPINGVSLPDASPIQPVAGQGEEQMTAGHAFFSATGLPSLALPCCETENLSILYTCSILYQRDQIVKRLGTSPSIK